MLSRRAAMIGGGGALAAAASAQQFAGSYTVRPEPVGPGIWLVRGADAPIAMANGGAIANLAIIATSAGSVLFDCGPSLAYGRALDLAVRRVTGSAVERVYVSHLHPDHAFGAAAWDARAIHALAGTGTGIGRDGEGFSDAMYRMLSSWMAGTGVVVPQGDVAEGAVMVGDRPLRLFAMAGHSEADLAILDETSGTLLAGDLVFHDRAPSTPHADLAAWRRSLDRLRAIPHRQLLPGHGPLDRDGRAIDQTRGWIDWLEASLRDALRSGLDMTEAGNLPIPPRFAGLAAARYELQRSVSHFYPRLEAELLPRVDGD